MIASQFDRNRPEDSNYLSANIETVHSMSSRNQKYAIPKDKATTFPLARPNKFVGRIELVGAYGFRTNRFENDECSRFAAQDIATSPASVVPSSSCFSRSFLHSWIFYPTLKGTSGKENNDKGQRQVKANRSGLSSPGILASIRLRNS